MCVSLCVWMRNVGTGHIYVSYVWCINKVPKDKHRNLVHYTFYQWIEYGLKSLGSSYLIVCMKLKFQFGLCNFYQRALLGNTHRSNNLIQYHPLHTLLDIRKPTFFTLTLSVYGSNEKKMDEIEKKSPVNPLFTITNPIFLSLFPSPCRIFMGTDQKHIKLIRYPIFGVFVVGHLQNAINWYK